jgi:hypothetical protein
MGGDIALGGKLCVLMKEEFARQATDVQVQMVGVVGHAGVVNEHRPGH